MLPWLAIEAHGLGVLRGRVVWSAGRGQVLCVLAFALHNGVEAPVPSIRAASGVANLPTTGHAHAVDACDGSFLICHDRRTVMTTEFLTAMARATKDLCTAQAKRAALEAKASERLAKAQALHDSELERARRVEADGWKRLMAVPGMTAATAAQLGGTTSIKVSRWIRHGEGD